MRVAEKVSRNISILRRELTGKGKRLSFNTTYEPQYLMESPEVRVGLPRHELTYRITDEEMAEVDYRRLAEHPAIKQNDLAHSTIVGIAEDEKRHAQQLRDILALLVKEGKIEELGRIPPLR